MPAKELLDTPLAMTADHHRAAIDAAATSLHTSQLLREAGELITAVTTLEEKAPSFVNRVQKTQLVSAKKRAKLLLAIAWFYSQLPSLQASKDPQTIYESSSGAEAKLKSKGFGPRA